MNARSLPGFNVCLSDVMFAYLKKKMYFLILECMQISTTAELSTMHLLALYAYNTSNFSFKKIVFLHWEMHKIPLQQKIHNEGSSIHFHFWKC